MKSPFSVMRQLSKPDFCATDGVFVLLSCAQVDKVFLVHIDFLSEFLGVIYRAEDFIVFECAEKHSHNLSQCHHSIMHLDSAFRRFVIASQSLKTI